MRFRIAIAGVLALGVVSRAAIASAAVGHVAGAPACVAPGAVERAGEPTTEHTRSIVCVALPAEPAWQDFAFLAALSASAVQNDGSPRVIAIGADGSLRAEASDFLRRYHPGRILQIGARTPDPGEPKPEVVAGDDADAVACELATHCFARSTRAVVCRGDDYTSALSAAVLATRWRAPLLFSSDAGLSARAVETIGVLGVRSACFVGTRDDAQRVAGSVPALERLESAADVARWMQKHALAIEYVAATAPSDRSAGRVRKLSLAAAALAAGRHGAVAPIEFESAAGEPPPTDASRVELTEHALGDFRKLLGRTPDTLCIVAMPEAIPMATVACADGIDLDPVTDLRYANVDGDPFVELACGRVIAEDALSATLLAARSLAYEELLEPAWSSRITIAEWERESAPAFARAGFATRLVEPAGAALETCSPFVEVAALVHASHASWLGLGSTYAADSSALLAPCVVETGGCSAASLDQDPDGRSVAARLLRNGAVAFAGNTRRAVAQYELYRSELWNALLAGASVGRAHRRALNCVVAAMLDHGESEHGLHRYELHAAALYADPALSLRVPAAPKLEPARVELRGGQLVMHAPSEWWRTEVFAPTDWQRDPNQKITALRAAGVGVESRWDGEHRRNEETLVYTAEVRTEKKVGALEPVDPPAAPLGGSGRFFVDEHDDGSRSLFVRAVLVDFDMDRGEVRSRVDTLRWRVK